MTPDITINDMETAEHITLPEFEDANINNLNGTDVLNMIDERIKLFLEIPEMYAASPNEGVALMFYKCELRVALFGSSDGFCDWVKTKLLPRKDNVFIPYSTWDQAKEDMRKMVWLSGYKPSPIKINLPT